LFVTCLPRFATTTMLEPTILHKMNASKIIHVSSACALRLVTKS